MNKRALRRAKTAGSDSSAQAPGKNRKEKLFALHAA
jgi:hypothetical protein